MPRAEVTTNGLKRDLTKKKYKPWSSIAEYIWNSFDAGASVVDVHASYNELGGVESISISDNGHGVLDPKKFAPMFESDKKQNPEALRVSSIPRGKDGLGRFTFFTFAGKATWFTVYQGSNDCNYEFEVSISSHSLLVWNLEKEPVPTNKPIGTKVIFTLMNVNFTDIKDPDILSYLKQEFSWFLELNKANEYRLNINDIPLDYKEIILEREQIQDKEIDGYKFEFSFILWSSRLNEEYSRYYLIDSSNIERFSKTTTLNNKGDDFFHSIYVKSELFDKMTNIAIYETKGGDKNLFQDTNEGKAYNKMLRFLDDYLHDKRKPFIERESGKIVFEFEKQGVFPTYDQNNDLAQFRKNSLYHSVKQLYIVQPKIFTSLSLDQRKIFVRFLEIIQDSGQSEKIFDVLNEVISLDSADLEQLSKTLKSSRLSNIIKTIQLIEDRYKVISSLEKLIYQKELNANEPDHIQKIVESNYWIFGEKYHLVSAEEADFEAALKGYVHLLRSDTSQVEHGTDVVTHPGKRRQMDIFMCRKNVNDDSINHIVIELKNPKIKLGRRQLDQVEDYMSTILSIDMFNASNSFWEFYLIGNDFDSSGLIESRIETAKNHGERSLVVASGNYKVYVKRWSEVINDVNIRHKFLHDKLKVERHKLMEEKDIETADEIVKNAVELSSTGHKPIVQTRKQRKQLKSKAQSKQREKGAGG